MLTTEINKAVAKTFLDKVSNHEINALCEMVSPSWRMYGGPPDLPAGPEGIKTLFGTFGSITQHWTIEDIIAERDKVVVRCTNTCTQDSFFGIPGEGKMQTFSAMFIHEIKDGKITQTWRNANDLGRLFQLGAKIVPGNMM